MSRSRKDPRPRVLTIGVTREEKAILRAEAKRRGMTLEAFVLEVIAKAAREALGLPPR